MSIILLTRRILAERTAQFSTPLTYTPPDVIRATTPAPAPAPATTAAPAPSSTDSCGGKCLADAGTSGAGAPAPGGASPAPSMLVASSGGSPTSGIFDVSHLPPPAQYPGKFESTDTASADSTGKIPEKEKGSLMWVLVVMVLFLLLSDPKKGSRKSW